MGWFATHQEGLVAKKRDHWGSSMAFILAASGSAVGLGNLWKFPYITYENEGGAFVIVYLACILAIGLPIMLAEILIGRKTQSSPIAAFTQLAAGKPASGLWRAVGWLGVLTGGVILAFYAVIAGWSLSSLWQCINWSFSGYEAPSETAFGDFVGNGTLQVFLAFLFSGATALIVVRGISGGIEKATKILMPVLFIILILLVIVSFTLKGSSEAFRFLFTPDFSKFSWHGGLEALGHAFFTLSLGMGAMITYGSYMQKSESINKAGIAIVILDTIIAIVACIIMFSIIFSFEEIQNSVGRSTAGMLFITLPPMFYTKMPLGTIIGPIFYILVAFAAMSSTISLLEVVVSSIVDKWNVPRKKATIGASATIFVFSVLCALSNGANGFLSNFKPFGNAESGIGYQLNQIFFGNKAGILNLFDHFSANWMLPVGGLFITLFVGWILKPEVAMEELDLADGSGRPNHWFKLFRFSVAILAPLAIAFIIIMVVTGKYSAA